MLVRLLVCPSALPVCVVVDSFRPPFRVKTTYLLYTTTVLGYLVGGVVGNILYGNPNAKPKAKTTTKH